MVLEKMSKIPNFWHLIPLNPRIKIFFQNSGHVTFFTLLTPNFMQSFRKIEWAVSEIFKDWLTDGLTDKGDYYGPHWVNPGSKNQHCLVWACFTGTTDFISKFGHNMARKIQCIYRAITNQQNYNTANIQQCIKSNEKCSIAKK